MRRAALAMAALLALVGCDDSLPLCDGGLCQFDDGLPDRPDMAPECAPPAREIPGLGCTQPPSDRAGRCALVAALGVSCADRDGDCAVGACDRALPAAVVDWLSDCDDGRVAVQPGAAERCDGLDNDCDGATDEDFELDSACEACGRSGRWECRADGGGARACSVEAGQSEATTGETCDGLDDDCDGAVDEACRVRLPPDVRLRQPAVCGGGRLAVVRDDALWVITEDDPGRWRADAVEAADPDLGVAYPACSPSLLAWLAAPEPCEAPEGGPLICPRASLWALDTEQAFDLTGQAAPGPPVVSDDAVLWHADVAGRPVLKRHDRGQRGITDVQPGLALSDPTSLALGRWAARQWVGGSPEVVLWTGEAFDPALVPLRPSGPPALGDRWLVWVLDEAALWAVPLDAERPVGVQLTAGGGPHRAPKVVGDHVVWIDAGAQTLRHLDLRTGTGGVLFDGPVAPADLAAGHGEVVWVAATPEGTALHRHRFEPP